MGTCPICENDTSNCQCAYKHQNKSDLFKFYESIEQDYVDFCEASKISVNVEVFYRIKMLYELRQINLNLREMQKTPAHLRECSERKSNLSFC